MRMIAVIYPNLLAAAAALLVLFNLFGRKNNAFFRSGTITVMLSVNLILLLLDSAARLLDGRSGRWVTVADEIVLSLMLMVLAALAVLVVLYVDFQVFSSKAHLKRTVKLMLFLLIPVMILVTANPLTGSVFRLGASNVYSGGGLLYVYAAICDAGFFVILAMLVFGRRRIEHRKLLSLLRFSAFPFIGGLLQLACPQIPIVCPCVTLSLIEVYISLQSSSLTTDYLTGIFNKMHLDEHILQKVRRCSPDRTFSAIMIDLDNFKEINDRFGHKVGDDALETAAMLLKQSIGQENFLARIGGDEFLAVLNADDYPSLLKVTRRINGLFDHFNASGKKVYRLSLSMGYDVYSYKRRMTKDQFLKHIDCLMYLNKRNKKKMWSDSEKAQASKSVREAVHP
ncbi:MAG TPA: GGDEF domain-containing protein [Clostridia bacterium]|nr:GGDEF domain-containing protein [Clostridia bacterium]